MRQQEIKQKEASRLAVIAKDAVEKEKIRINLLAIEIQRIDAVNEKLKKEEMLQGLAKRLKAAEIERINAAANIVLERKKELNKVAIENQTLLKEKEEDMRQQEIKQKEASRLAVIAKEEVDREESAQLAIRMKEEKIQNDILQVSLIAEEKAMKVEEEKRTLALLEAEKASQLRMIVEEEAVGVEAERRAFALLEAERASDMMRAEMFLKMAKQEFQKKSEERFNEELLQSGRELAVNSSEPAVNGSELAVIVAEDVKGMNIRDDQIEERKRPDISIANKGIEESSVSNGIKANLERMLTMSKVEEENIGMSRVKVEEKIVYDIIEVKETNDRTVSDVIKANLMDSRIFNPTEKIQEKLVIDDSTSINSSEQDAERSRALKKIEGIYTYI
jgi:hypothetical protein